jgi:hypothetical protein
MVTDVKLGTLAVELGLGDVARVREAAGVFQAGGEHRRDKGHSQHFRGFVVPTVKPRGLSARSISPSGFVPHAGRQPPTHSISALG